MTLTLLIGIVAHHKITNNFLHYGIKTLYLGYANREE